MKNLIRNNFFVALVSVCIISSLSSSEPATIEIPLPASNDYTATLEGNLPFKGGLVNYWKINLKSDKFSAVEKLVKLITSRKWIYVEGEPVSGGFSKMYLRLSIKERDGKGNLYFLLTNDHVLWTGERYYLLPDLPESYALASDVLSYIVDNKDWTAIND